MRILFVLTMVFWLLKPMTGHAHKTASDSLIRALMGCKVDTTKLHILNSIVETSPDDNVWPAYNTEMQKLALKCMKSKQAKVNRCARFFYGASLLNYGYLYINKGRLVFALTQFEKGYEIMQKLGNKHNQAAALNNMGYVYKSLGDVPRALETYHKALEIYEGLKYDNGMANTYNNIAILYNKQGNFDAAIDFNMKSLKLAEKSGNKMSMGISMNNLALLYEKKKGWKLAFDYLNEALALQIEIDDKEGIANSYNNLGYLSERKGLKDDAMTYYKKAHAILQTIDDKVVLISTGINIGTMLLARGEVNESAKYAEQAYELAKKTRYIDELSDAADLLSKVYTKKKMYKEALEMHNYYVKMRDSALNESTKTATMQMQVRYEYQKKAAADSVKNLQARRLKEAELKASQSELKAAQTMKYVLYGGLAIVILFALSVFSRYKTTREKNRIIAEQKTIVEEKQREVMDSILYAKRIQNSLLASEKYMDKHLRRLRKEN